MSGCAAIGHVRYATCGKDDVNYAQPFERGMVDYINGFHFVSTEILLIMLS